MKTEDAQVLIVGSGPGSDTVRAGLGVIAAASRTRTSDSRRVARTATYLQKTTKRSAKRIVFGGASRFGQDSARPVVPGVGEAIPERRASVAVAGGWAGCREPRPSGWKGRICTSETRDEMSDDDLVTGHCVDRMDSGTNGRALGGSALHCGSAPAEYETVRGPTRIGGMPTPFRVERTRD